MKHLLEKDPVLSRVAAAEEVLWFNPKLQPVSSGLQELPLGMEDIRDAEARLARFAPFIEACFPETAPRKGLIESPLTPIPAMQKLLEERFGAVIPGKLLLKQDSHLAIAGSVKARGGIYEVLKHAEDLAIAHGILKPGDDYDPSRFQFPLDPAILEKRLGYTFQNRALLENALTHSSCANESRGRLLSNERLEFLGDAVLELAVSRYLFSHYPDVQEGKLTLARARLVREETLYAASKQFDLYGFLQQIAPKALRTLKPQGYVINAIKKHLSEYHGILIEDGIILQDKKIAKKATATKREPTSLKDIFGVDENMVTSDMRRHAKAVNFGIVYGISSFGLSQDLSISPKEAKGYIDEYFKTYPGIKTFLDKTVADAKEKGYCESLFGRRRPVPELKSSNFMQRSFGERIAMNSPIQGTAADIIKMAMLHVFNALRVNGLKSKLILQIHDELLIETKESEVEQVKALLAEEMRNATNCAGSLACEMAVRMEVDLHTGENWYETK